jgi:hypothetical protein
MQSILTAIDQQIVNLQRVRALLESNSTGATKRRGRPPASAKVHTISAHAPATKRRKRGKMSAEGRARIVAAQKARWAKVKKAAKA